MDPWLALSITLLVVGEVALTAIIVRKRRRDFPVSLGGKLARTWVVPAVLIAAHLLFKARSVAHGMQYALVVLTGWVVVTLVLHPVLKPRQETNGH